MSGAQTSLFSDRRIVQRPVTSKPQSYGEFFAIVAHPAFRIGFLDARAGHALNHESIMLRIEKETPAGALDRIGWRSVSLFDQRAVELAQYRYEEGRLAFLDLGLRCKSWGHPDFPPADLLRYINTRVTSDS